MPDTGLILYEFPCSEKIRFYLRLEALSVWTGSWRSMAKLLTKRQSTHFSIFRTLLPDRT